MDFNCFCNFHCFYHQSVLFMLKNPGLTLISKTIGLKSSKSVHGMKKGLAGGYEDGTFRVDKSITRAEFTTLSKQGIWFYSTRTNKF